MPSLYLGGYFSSVVTSALYPVFEVLRLRCSQTDIPDGVAWQCPTEGAGHSSVALLSGTLEDVIAFKTLDASPERVGHTAVAVTGGAFLDLTPPPTISIALYAAPERAGHSSVAVTSGFFTFFPPVNPVNYSNGTDRAGHSAVVLVSGFMTNVAPVVEYSHIERATAGAASVTAASGLYTPEATAEKSTLNSANVLSGTLVVAVTDSTDRVVASSASIIEALMVDDVTVDKAIAGAASITAVVYTPTSPELTYVAVERAKLGATRVTSVVWEINKGA